MTAQGFYRVSPSLPKWQALKVPETMPPGGRFTGATNAGADIYYWIPVATPDESSHVHRSAAGTGPWEPVTVPAGLHVLMALDRALFAVTAPYRSSGTPSERILRSTDHGRTWEEPTPNLPPAGQLRALFPDPDHTGRVCAHADGLRALVLQTTDAGDAWQMFRGSEWDRRHPDTARFFAERYSSSTQIPMIQATLGNYFNLAFGDAIILPDLRLSVEAPRTFRLGTSMVVTVELALRSEARTATLVDAPEADACWGVKWIGPDGTPMSTGPKAPAPGTRPATATPWRLAPGTPYRRTLDLQQLATFRQPGRHRVQVVYSSFYRADRKKGQWPVEVSGPVMELDVLP